MDIEPYQHDRDYEALCRIWREVGWLKPPDPEGRISTDFLLEASRCWVAHVDGAAECAVTCTAGDIRYLEESLPFSGVSSVVTGRAGRKQGLAAATTARAVAHEVERGAIVCGLTMFEQGFYDRLGFGTCAYDHRVAFDPSRLLVEAASRPARRIDLSDWEQIHRCRMARAKRHGAISFHPPEMTRYSMLDAPKGAGLGYFDGPNGELTHHIWFTEEDLRNGPYWIRWMAYQTPAQLLELFGLLKNLGDQVRLVSMLEPSDLQLQVLVHQPIGHRNVTANTPFASGMQALAFYQMRICDIAACLEKTRLVCDEFKFNAVISDPIGDFLAADSGWRGVAGEYVVTLGRVCRAAPGSDPALPVLEASVNAFTRMWLGVRPASGLAITDALAAPPDLMKKLDEAFRLPPCLADWDY